MENIVPYNAKKPKGLLDALISGQFSYVDRLNIFHFHARISELKSDNGEVLGTIIYIPYVSADEVCMKQEAEVK